MAKTQYVKIKKPKFNSRNNVIVNGFRDSSIQNPKIIVEIIIK
jgi:hypothetical protein